MVEAILQPLNIFLLGLGGGFTIPLLNRIASPLPSVAFVVALAGITAISGICWWMLLNGQPAFEIFTAGSIPPFSINLRFGLWEGFFAFFANVVALLGAWQLWPRLRQSYATQLLYLILVTGINGMVMTRDLFNLFVFLEIVSIATYGLLGLERTPAALVASVKYIMATVLASSFFLLGSLLLYHATGTLNIDDLIAQRDLITGPLAKAAVLFVFAALVIELKPFPANGWGLDVYETAPAGVAAMISVGVSAGVLFALMKLLPLFADHLFILALSGGATFLFSNLIGLRQTNVQRMLGYSSVSQIGLVMLALALLEQVGAEAAVPLVVGGLFVNHLLAKAGLFWLAGAVERREIESWSTLARRPLILVTFATLIVAIAGLPPFPGFWSKWELVMQLTRAELQLWTLVVLTGSLLEAAYMFRWFAQALRQEAGKAPVNPQLRRLAPSIGTAMLLLVGGHFGANVAGAASGWLFVPLYAGGILLALDRLPGRVKFALMLAVVLFASAAMASDQQGLNRLFAVILLTGGLVVASAGLYRSDSRRAYAALMAVMLLSMTGVLTAATSLEFFYHWELVTLSSYFLIAQRQSAQPHLLPYLLFSLASAFCLLAGFGLSNAANGTVELAAFRSLGAEATAAYVLLAIGFLVKAGALGMHVWLPGAYAEADDDFSAMLSAVLSKVAIFGLFLITYLAIRSQVGLELAHLMAWIGMLTTVAGAAMALWQDDVKRLLAYSSMSQLGYIITAIALMSHLGWVTALYLVANHLMVKGILFLAIAGIVLRTNSRSMDDYPGLARNMPVTFAVVAIALVSMSGLPPLAGFGGKWLLLSALVDRQWYGLVVLGVVATFIGLAYMARLAFALFGPARQIPVREAPLQLLLPQFVLVAAIFGLSFFPKLVIDPVSAAIDPYFASTLVWEGMSLETIYGYWNPLPVMAASMAGAAMLFVLTWLIYTMTGVSRARRGVTGLYDFYRSSLSRFSVPVASAFWDGAGHLVCAMGGAARRVYTGNGQTYLLYVLYYIAAFYAVASWSAAAS